jgi:Zn-finger nucleic acid-binding protein
VKCPKSHDSLEAVDVGGIRIDRCPTCEGLWFDKNELRVLRKKEAGDDYRWLHIELWKDIDKFRARRQQRYSCPRDGRPLTTVHYGDSDVAFDVCSTCQGMWLDKEEYQEIVSYLEKTVDGSSAEDHLKDVRNELVEVFEGHESPLGALKDIGKILYLLELRFTVDHPTLADVIVAFPRF